MTTPSEIRLVYQTHAVSAAWCNYNMTESKESNDPTVRSGNFPSRIGWDEAGPMQIRLNDYVHVCGHRLTTVHTFGAYASTHTAIIEVDVANYAEGPSPPDCS